MTTVFSALGVLWVSWALAGLWHKRDKPADDDERVDDVPVPDSAPAPRGWRIRAAFWLGTAACVLPALHVFWHTLATLFGLPCP